MRYFNLTLAADPRYPRINTAGFEDEEQPATSSCGAERRRSEANAGAGAAAGAEAGTGKDGRSLFVNASTWTLILTGRFMDWQDEPATDLPGTLRKRLQCSGEPVVRQALRQAMKILGEQFVMGRDIGAALARSRNGGEAR